MGWPSWGLHANDQVNTLSPWGKNRTLPSANPAFMPPVCPVEGNIGLQAVCHGRGCCCHSGIMGGMPGPKLLVP
jgi:hypothetical protein